MAREKTLSDMRILVADDNESNAELVQQILAGAGYRQVSITRAAEDVPRLCALEPEPDLLVLDLHMPGLSGWEILARLRPMLLGPPYLPVLVVTADITSAAKRRALSLGASDFLTKPVDPPEVLLRTRNLLRTHQLRQNLEALVSARTAQLEQVRYEVLQRLALAAELRDDTTGQHIRRVGRTAALLAAELGLAEPMPELIGAAAQLHDVGKIGIPDAILLKPGALTSEEMLVMRRHVDIGGRILHGGEYAHLRLAHDIALYHHERWDGSGYNTGRAGESIPIGARITAVADSFDAISHARPHRQGRPVEWAVAEIESQRGAQFDPEVVDAFMRLDHADPAVPRDLAANRRAA